jgi:regulator of sigma E protease
MPILLTILGISLLIFIHEFGHFLCARLAGVKVHVFSLGFGPRLWGFQRGGTDYRISAMPLGGYVQVAGDDPTYNRRLLGANDLCSKGFFARGFFYSGGVLMNLLFALIAFPLVFNTGVLFDAPIIGAVDPGGPAWEAGMQGGDRIVSADGKAMYSFPNFRVEAALANSRRGIEVVYERDGNLDRCTVYPRYSALRGLRTLGVVSSIEKGPFPLEVTDDTPEYQAGMRTGDVLLTFAGSKIFTREDLRAAIAQYTTVRVPAGDKEVTVTIRRPRKPGDAQDPGAGEEHEFKFTPSTNRESPARIGVAPAALRVAGIRQGNADAILLGIQRGDRLRFVNGNPFRGGTLDLTGPGDTVTITVSRKDVAAPVVLRAAVPAARRRALAAAVALEGDLESLAVKPVPGSPAAMAGIVEGDIVKAINGAPVKVWNDLVQIVRAAAKNAPGKPITLAVVTTKGLETVTVTPRRDAVLGFVPVLKPLRTLFQTETLSGALAAGSIASFDFVKQIYVTLKRLFTGDVSTKNLGGIITISRVSYAYAQEGLARLFYFLAILSINLAVINVLPIPVLDGGHLMFLLIERIKGTPVSTKVHNYSQILGLVFVLALMVYVTYNDLLKLSWFS